MDKYKLINKIAKEGHSFPHGDTCQTCIGDYDDLMDYALECVAFAMELRCRGLSVDIDTQENKEFFKGGKEMMEEFKRKLGDFEYIKNYIESKVKYMTGLEKRKWI